MSQTAADGMQPLQWIVLALQVIVVVSMVGLLVTLPFINLFVGEMALDGWWIAFTVVWYLLLAFIVVALPRRMGGRSL